MLLFRVPYTDAVRDTETGDTQQTADGQGINKSHSPMTTDPWQFLIFRDQSLWNADVFCSHQVTDHDDVYGVLIKNTPFSELALNTIPSNV